MRDDLLDVEGSPEETGKAQGQDAHNARVTFVSLLGIEGSRALLNDLKTQAMACLDALPQKGHLSELLSFVVDRRW